MGAELTVDPLVIALAAAAALLAGIALFQSRGSTLLGWAVLALAAIHLLGAL